MLGRTFGAAMGGERFSRLDGSDTVLSATSAAGHTQPLILQVVLQTVDACPDEATFLKSLVAAVAVEAARDTLSDKNTAHNAVWEELWSRSHVDISVGTNLATDGAAEGAGSLSAKVFEQVFEPSNVEAVNMAYVWQRYLDLCDGRDSWGIIKFNGQAFTTSLNGTQQGHKPGVVSADYRDWGPGNWIQNARQPYYAALAAGDSDVILGMLRYFNRSLPIARARYANMSLCLPV
eukprot:COSAG02_NODE_7053_length_3207_cov_2.684041_2_plen_234_part_00